MEGVSNMIGTSSLYFKGCIMRAQLKLELPMQFHRTLSVE